MMNRQDGRGLDKLRKVQISRNFIKYAEGSCLIEFGNTKVVCTASVEETVPPFLRGTGTGWVTAEYGMLPRSCQQRIQRDKNSGRTYEIQRLIGRSLRAVTDMKKIGERTVWIDCDVIQGDGGTRSASITGGFIALADALVGLKKKNIIEKVPLTDYVAAVSVGIMGKDLLLDLAYDEDSRADVDMNIIMTGQGRFIEVQGTAERSPFDKMQMDGLLDLARKGILDLIDMQRNYFKDFVA